MSFGILLAISSAFLFCVRSQVHFYGLAIPYWCFFYLGALSFWSGLGRSIFWIGTFIGMCALLAALNEEMLPPLVVAATTSILIIARSRLTLISRMLCSRPALGLGRISYSLYLFHAIFGWTSISLAKRLGILAALSPAAQTIGLFTLGVTTSIVASRVLYILIERPAAKLSQRL